MKIKKTSRKMGKKISQYCLILALVITGLTTLNVNAEEKIFTEDGYFTEEEIKEVNQMDTISMAPINATPSYGGDGANQQKPQISTFSIQPLAFEKQGFIFPNHTNNAGGKGDDVIHIYTSATSTSRITSISNIVRMTGVIPFIDATETRYRTIVSGVEGWVDKKFFTESKIADTKAWNIYTIGSNRVLTHNIAYQSTGCEGNCNYGTIDNGPAPDYLGTSKMYSSFDGHYFYEINPNDVTNSLGKMFSDYLAGHRNSSVNATNPFYNYYQFLPFRAMTNYSPDIIETYLSSKGYKNYADTNDYNVVSKDSSLSKLKDQTKHFYEFGVKFSLNPVLTFGIAVNESAWGRSAISVKKNNIFGHGAIDSNPDDAYMFESVRQSIYEIMTPTINWGYLDSDPTVYTNYNGGYLGDKAGGFNVMYATDPYWGQKAARTYYEIDRLHGSLDYNKSTVGITKKDGEIKVYLEPKLNAQYSYPKGSSGHVGLTYRNTSSVLVLETVKGEVLNGSDQWYKVRSDFMMTSDRKPTPTTADKEHRKLPYLSETSYYYIHSSDVSIITNGSVIVTPSPGTPPVEPTYKLGDVNNDGKISLLDMAMIKSHLLGNIKLIDDPFKAGDINKDSKITLIDLALVKSHLLGNKPIE